MLKFLFLQFLFVLRNQALRNNLDLCLSDVQLYFLLNLTSIQSDFSRWVAGREKKLSSVVETLATSTELCIPSRFVNCPVSNIQYQGSMKFHFNFLLLIDGSSFFLVSFQFSILSTIDNAPREHLIENKARFALFFCLHFGQFGKGRHYIRKHTLRNLGKRFPDSVV